MFSTRTSYFMKSPDIFVLSLICRANIFSNIFFLNLIWYHFILNLEIREWNLYFLNENVLHLNNKNKPCFLRRFIDFLSPKVAVLLFLNSQIGVFAFAKISRLAAMSVRRYISSVFRLCYPNRFICICIYLKPNEEMGNKRVREKIGY